jgi:trypsin
MIWNQRDCSEKWFGQVNYGMFCAGGDRGFDSCNGDSGGSLVINGMQVGIISAGATDCGVAFPSVFVNITNPLIRAFIRERTGI